MKIQDPKHIVSVVARAVGLAVLMPAVCLLSGCVALGLLLSPGWNEKGVPPAYNLLKQQERKVMVWIECPVSVRADFDVAGKMVAAYQLYLIERAGFEPENVLLNPVDDKNSLNLNPQKIARSLGAGYVLLVHVSAYETDFLHVRDYYAGELVTQAILIDVDLGTTVWPPQPEGKMIHISVDMETNGRDALISRLASASAHCTLRNLYPCDKLKYKHGDERISMQEAYEIETF